jgi:hypothetical protein
MQNNAAGQAHPAVICLQVEPYGTNSPHPAHDPSDAFMQRFQDIRTTMRKASQCTADASRGVLDSATGAHGLLFRLDSLKRVSADEYQAEGGYYEAGLSSSGNSYTIQRKSGAWKVTKNRMNWIS